MVYCDFCRDKDGDMVLMRENEAVKLAGADEIRVLRLPDDLKVGEAIKISMEVVPAADANYALAWNGPAFFALMDKDLWWSMGCTGIVMGDSHLNLLRHDLLRLGLREPGEWKDMAREVIRKEISLINMWLWGYVKKYVLERKLEDGHYELVRSCSGFYVDTDDLISHVLRMYDIKPQDHEKERVGGDGEAGVEA